MRFVDPLAGLIVSGMIIKAGLETGYQSVLELVDAAIPMQHMEPYRETILRVEGVKGFNHLRGRRAGSFLYLDVNVEVDPFSSVSAAHDIGENVRREIQQSHPEIAEVFVHIEPSTSNIPSVHVEKRQDQNAVTTGDESTTVSLECTDIEDVVSNILSSEFSEEMDIVRITRHILKGQTLLQIEVSMPSNILVSDAIEVANKAKKRIMEVVPENVRVSTQLRLERSMPHLNSDVNGLRP